MITIKILATYQYYYLIYSYCHSKRLSMNKGKHLIYTSRCDGQRYSNSTGRLP